MSSRLKGKCLFSQIELWYKGCVYCVVCQFIFITLIRMFINIYFHLKDIKPQLFVNHSNLIYMYKRFADLCITKNKHTYSFKLLTPDPARTNYWPYPAKNLFGEGSFLWLKQKSSLSFVVLAVFVYAFCYCVHKRDTAFYVFNILFEHLFNFVFFEQHFVIYCTARCKFLEQWPQKSCHR